MSKLTSTNERAGKLMGYRPEGVIPFDQPCELGYRCPVCLVPAMVGDEYDLRLHWSEYNGFLWCYVCDFDYPSVMCIDLTLPPTRPWVNGCREDAVKVFLDSIEDAVERAFRQGVDPDDETASPSGSPA